MKRNIYFLIFTLSTILVYACALSPVNETPPQVTSEAVSTVTIPDASDTPDLPKQLVYIERSEGWDNVRAELGIAVETLAEEQGWQFESVKSSTGQELFEQAALIVVFGGDAEGVGLIEANPQATFIFVGVSGILPGERVAVIGPEGMRTDQVAFLSGYVSALTTPDWRIGMIGRDSTGEGRAALTSFINGGVFFCGLCRPSYPPFHEYPTSVAVTALDVESVRIGLDRLRDLSVTTIGIDPSFPSDSVDLAMDGDSSDQLFWIGPNPPNVKNRDRWIVTIQPDPASILNDIFIRLYSGEVDISVPMPLAVLDVNDAILTEGKLRLVLQIRDALVQGSVDTGVDPQTGLER